MASQNPCVKNAAGGYTFYMALRPRMAGGTFQANPTLASGDVKIAIDDGAPANMATLPVVDADFTKRVKVVLSQAETNGDNITIVFSDAAGGEWCDEIINIQTVARNFDELASQTSVDDLPTNAELATALGTADDAVLAAIASLNDLSAADMLAATYSSLTVQQLFKGIEAVLLGKVSGGSTTTEKFRDAADTKDVIVASVDETGNRTTVTRDLS